MNEIFVKVKGVYGIDKVYPACDKSHLFADLIGTKTFTDYSLKLIRKLEYKITNITTLKDLNNEKN